MLDLTDFLKTFDKRSLFKFHPLFIPKFSLSLIYRNSDREAERSFIPL
ncbi:hypothetical protein [Okeania sp.]|nr:hypothetical protein [Okeania sp.]